MPQAQPADGVYRLTVIASAPAGAKQDIAGNDFIVDVTAKLSAAKNGPTPVRVTSIKDLSKALAAARAAATGAATPGGTVAPISLQIVGHATVGQLLLGGFWMTDPEQARTAPFFVCDTNPQALQMLISHRGHVCNVTLAGCNVGAPITDHPVVNGRVLTYCLGEALQCKVEGAVQFVSVDDFDDDSGLYKPTSAGWSWKPAPPSLDWYGNLTADAIDAHDTTINITQITSTRLPLPHGTTIAVKPVAIVIEAAKVDRADLRYATQETSVTTDIGSGAFVDNGRYFVTADAQFEVRNRAAVAQALYAQITA
jgi:hypothetical protein